MVVVEDFDEPAMLGRIARKLLEAVAQPFKIEEHDIYVTSSIGISVYPDDSDDPEELLKHADVAMYHSKELGRNTFQFLDADLAQHRLRQHTLESALRNALKDGLLRLHYQPIVRLADNADRRRRGAAALERRGARQHLAQGLHRARRGIGPDPRARRMGAPVRGGAMRRVAQGRAAAERVDQPVRPPVLSRRHRATDLATSSAARAASRRGSSSR